MYLYFHTLYIHRVQQIRPFAAETDSETYKILRPSAPVTAVYVDFHSSAATSATVFSVIFTCFRGSEAFKKILCARHAGHILLN